MNMPFDGAVTGLSGWIACFPKAHLAGYVFCGGVNAVGEIKGNAVLEKSVSDRKKYLKISKD